MAIGQTAVKVKQSVSFYNTTGVIEYHKNIYFCPTFSTDEVDLKVYQAYMNKFNSVCPPDNDYVNIDISRWSPEDRTLVIVGNVDNFRGRYQTYGKGLNYMILKREVGDDSTFYYAFFIKDAKQVGANSVSLELQNDDWTNTFYLLNNEIVSIGYDPYNKLIKNARIDRQHYDRVERNGIPVNMDLFVNTPETYKYKYQYRDFKSPLRLLSTTNRIEKLDPVKVREINANFSFSDLTTEEKQYVLVNSICFVNIVMNRNKAVNFKIGGNNWNLFKQYEDTDSQIISPYYKFTIPFLNVPKVFDKFKEDLSTGIGYRFEFICSNLSYGEENKNAFEFKPDELLSTLLSGSNGYGQFIESIYITKDSDLYSKLNVSQDYRGILLQFNVDLYITRTLDSTSLKNNNYSITFFKKANVSQTDYDIETTQPEFNVYHIAEYSSDIFPCAYQTTPKRNKKTLYLDNKLHKNKNEYFDNILDCEPYSFYSISYLGLIEVPLSKSRYYKSFDTEIPYTNSWYKIDFEIISAFSSIYQIGLIPFYTIEGITSEYYNESITFSGSDSIPFISSAYNEYLVANKYQMKNQYAVNDYQRGTDLAQRFFNTSPARVGQSAISGFASTGNAMGAGLSAIGATIGEISGMIDDGIDWAQSNKVITLNQKAKLADLGELPNNLKQVGTDAIYTLNQMEVGFYLNHYNIDELSYNSICKYLERFGYKVDIMDKLNCYNRVGWNFIRLSSFDIDGRLTIEQEEVIANILKEGITLLHNPTIFAEGSHNYETILE